MKIIPISGEIGWDVMPHNIRAALEEAAGEDVEFQVSSPGGYIYDGLEIFNLIRNYQGKTTARIIGMAASMASYIPLAADKVIAESNAIYMIHNARAYSYGDQNAHAKIAKILTGMSNLLAREYIKKTGKAQDEISQMMAEETYLYGDEIMAAGFVDEMIDVGEPEQARDDIVLDAMARFEILDKKLQEQPEKFENINKIAAIVGDKPPVSPANRNPNQEDNMTFEEFCNKYPEEAKRITAWLEAAEKEKLSGIQAKHEEDLTLARAEVESGKLTKETVKAVGAIIASESYGQSVKNAGIKVLTGEKDYSSFEDLVALADENNEKIKSMITSANQPPKTPAEDHELQAGDKKAILASARELGAKFGTAKKEDK